MFVKIWAINFGRKSALFPTLPFPQHAGSLQGFWDSLFVALTTSHVKNVLSSLFFSSTMNPWQVGMPVFSVNPMEKAPQRQPRQLDEHEGDEEEKQFQ